MTQEFDHAVHRLKIGAERPYDAPDNWERGRREGENPFPAKDAAHAAARGIIADMCDRRGIKHGFQEIDAEVRAEIVETTAEIIRRAYQQLVDTPLLYPPAPMTVGALRAALALFPQDLLAFATGTTHHDGDSIVNEVDPRVGYITKDGASFEYSEKPAGRCTVQAVLL